MTGVPPAQAKLDALWTEIDVLRKKALAMPWYAAMSRQLVLNQILRKMREVESLMGEAIRAAFQKL